MKSKKSKIKELLEENNLNSSQKFFLVWNTFPYAEYLANLLGKQTVIIQSEKELNSQNFDNSDIIIIAAELDWDCRPLSQFYGIEILKKLRFERRILNHIFFCSVLPEKFFYSDKHRGRFEILKSPGHHFIQLPLNLSLLKTENLQPLEPETLDDIIESFSDLEGLLSGKIHNLKNATIVTAEDKKLTVDEFKQKIKSLIETSAAEISSLLNDLKVMDIKESIIKEIDDRITSQENYDKVIEIISNFDGQLRLLLPSKKQDNVIQITEKPKWKILFVDDEQHIRERVKNEFEKRNIECITTSTAEDALIELDKDAGKNWITALVVDYRLETLDKYWQEMQGYLLLKHIHLNKPNFLAYFALTAAHRKVLMRVQTSYHMRVIPYSKEDILSSTGEFNMFTERVIEEAEKVYDVVCSQPQLTSWKEVTGKNIKPLKEYYRAHRASLDYDEAEEDISKKALDYVQIISNAYESHDPEPQGHKHDFQAKLDKPPTSQEMLDKFRLRLLGRRIAIGLYAKLGFARELIFYAMRKNPCLDIHRLPIEKRVGEKSIDALLATALALSLEDDFPDNLLVEERFWLENYLKIDINLYSREAYEALESCIQEFLEDKSDINININIKISNRSSAEKQLTEVFRIVKEKGCENMLINKLNSCLFNDEYYNLNIALRVSGLEKVLKKFGVKKSFIT